MHIQWHKRENILFAEPTVRGDVTDVTVMSGLWCAVYQESSVGKLGLITQTDTDSEAERMSLR